MDLQSIVGRGPCNAGSEEFGHACFEIAAFVGVFLAGREISQLARADQFGGHHDKLVGHTREFIDRTFELVAVERIAQAKFERVLGNAYGAGGSLDAGAFKCRHKIAEAHALIMTKQIVSRDSEAIKA